MVEVTRPKNPETGKPNRKRVLVKFGIRQYHMSNKEARHMRNQLNRMNLDR